MCQPVTIIFFWFLLLPLLVVMLFFPTSLYGVLVFDSVSRLRLARLARHLCHTPSFQFHTPLCHPPSFTHNFVTHTTLSHTIFHTPLCHPPSFTLNFVTHHLSHTTLSPTIFHTQLCHTPSFTHTHTPPLCHPPSFIRNFVTHHLSHTTLSHTHNFVTHHLSHTTLSHTISWWHLPSFCVAGVELAALGWLWWRPWACFGRRWRSGTLRGRRGTWRHPPGRRGAWWHLPSFCVTGVALAALGWLCHLLDNSIAEARRPKLQCWTWWSKTRRTFIKKKLQAN